ncbi:MAG TPA: hypothetical protein H9815_04460 [Candidatus Ruania gallistercoris]|uniref:Uncharacterized protein n=1 Tax=Candidatus Ruania gallistercoris TaxID=2838746 RepID=A0A9D2ECA3_9MICO|nr:hypothetical protein [Candidatus Ruania gallistercoris]
MSLRVLGDEILHLDQGTHMWIQITRFGIDAGQDDWSLLGALIASPGYAHDYASPFDPDEGAPPGGVHGRWRREAIHSGLFAPCPPQEALALLHTWADDQAWTEPRYRQPPRVRERLDSVLTVLQAGPVYRLNNPGADAEHEYGFVTGSLGFHELVVIDRASGCLHLVVASDD